MAFLSPGQTVTWPLLPNFWKLPLEESCPSFPYCQMTHLVEAGSPWRP